MCVQPIPSPRSVPVAERPRAAEERPPAAPLTFALIALNVAVFVGQVVYGGVHGLRDMSIGTVLAFGANFAGATLYEGRVETLLSACFVHGSILHIAFNMAALRQVGAFIERTVGPARMLPLYLLSGVAGSAASTFSGWLSGEQHVSVGASGAICGLIGAAMVLGYRIEGKSSPIMRAMGRWLLSIFALGFTVTFLIHSLAGHGGGFDNAAHVGGALAGVLTAAVWQRGKVYTPAARTGVFVLSSALILAAAIRVYRFDKNDPLATLMLDDRLEYAVDAIDQGRCSDAHMAIVSAQRMTKDSPEVGLVAENYKRRCGY